jgi:hypothetical protein
VTLSLTASANYALTNPSSATVVIQDRPVNDWLRANFTAAQLMNPAVSGDAADPANDGLPNLLKYALGLDPNSTTANPFSASVSNGIFNLTYALSLAATDVSVTPQWSTNLLTWSPGTNFYRIANVVGQATNQIITLQPSTAAPAGFVRFGVSRR